MALFNRIEAIETEGQDIANVVCVAANDPLVGSKFDDGPNQVFCAARYAMYLSFLTISYALIECLSFKPLRLYNDQLGH